MRIHLLILLSLIISSCGVKTPLTGQKEKPEDNITVIERNLTLTPASITDQNAAELFDLGIAPANSSSKILLYVYNTTTNILTIDTNALALKFSAAGKRWTIGSPNTCSGTLNAGSNCRVQIVLNNNATTALEDYTQPVEANLITGSAPTKTIPSVTCATGFTVSGSTCVPSNPQFGKLVFTGQKAADIAISTVPLMSTLRFSTLAETYIMSSGSMTKRFYMGNPVQTGNTIPVPTVIAPPNGTISKNTCTSLTGLPPLKACFFEVTYNYDASKPSLNESITFGTPAPLNGVSLDTTGAAITLAITNQPPVVPVQAASFAQVSKITDLTSATQQSRLYVTNTGSGVADLTTVSIPSPFIIAKTSCSTSQSVGSTCFIDLKVDTSKTSNISGVAPAITYGSSSSTVVAGQPVTPGQTGSCKSGFTYLNNTCVASNISQACTVLNGSGIQTSTDAGQTFGSCIVSSCSSSYQISADTLSCEPVLCTVANANLLNAATVTGDLVAGCNIASCNPTFTLLGGVCVPSNVSQLCTIATGNGVGTQYSVDAGQTYGACQISSCGTNYQVSSNSLSCEPVACTVSNANLLNAATVTGDLVTGCNIASCNTGFTLLNGSCQTSNVSKSCTVALGSGTGSQTSTDAGQTYGACQLTSCGTNYQVSGDQLSCQPVACTVANANLLEATAVTGDLVVGCSATSCNTGYHVSGNGCVIDAVACTSADAIANGVDLARSNSTVQGMNVAGNVSACLLADNSCDISSTLAADKKSCIIKTFNVTVNKLINQASISDITLGKINCLSNCSTETKTYDYGSMITLTATASPGYVVSNWTGCDSVSGNNCIISSINSDHIVSPVIDLKALSLTTTYSDLAIATDVSSLTIYKNGIVCSGTCLNTYNINDEARIVVTPNSFINIDGFTNTGIIGNLNTTVPNEITFNFIDSNLSSQINLSYKSFVTQPTVTLTGGTLNTTTLTTNQSVITVVTSNSSVAREMLLSTSSNCSSGSYVVFNANKNYNVPVNQTSNLSIKFKNGTQYSSCFPFSIIHDNVAPTIAINTLSSINNSNKTAYTISGTCSENTKTVSFNIGTVNSSVVCSGTTWTKTLDVSTVIDNASVAVSANISDAAGNNTIANTTVLKDVVAPTIAINTMSSINNANKTAYTISGTCSENTKTVSFNIGTVNSSVACSGTSWTKTLDVSTVIDNASVAVSANISDAAGNNTVTNSTVIKDIVVPTLANSQTGLISKGGQITLLGTCEGTLPITFTESGNTSNTSINCNSGTYSTPYTVVVGTDGTKTITLTETDLAGNTTAINVTYTLDKTAPTIGINLLTAISADNVATYSFSGTCSENGQVVNYSFTDANLNSISGNYTCLSSVWSGTKDLSTLIDGTITMSANISDLAGNNTIASQTVSKSTILMQTSVLAGWFTKGYIDGISGTGALASPSGLMMDSTGVLYIADNAVIRTISATGTLTSSVGNFKNAAIDGTGLNAGFKASMGISNKDSLGNYYIAESQSHIIRKVTSSGVVTTFAGAIGNGTGYADGTGISVYFNNPFAIVVDNSDNLYVTDMLNCRIRKITAAGVVSTFAGSGTCSTIDGTGTLASFSRPMGITKDASGNLYVVDGLSGSIRKVTTAGVVTTLAGGPNHNTGAVDGTGTAAYFFYPQHIVIDTSNNLYVSDTNANKIRKITQSGVVTTLAGSGTQGSTDGTGTAALFYNPTGLAIDGSNNLYVADNLSLIRKVTPAGVVTTYMGNRPTYTDGTGTAAKFFGLKGIVKDSTGNFFVLDGNKIRKVTAAGIVTTFAGSGTAAYADGTGTAASFNSPAGITIDGSNNLYVADFYNYRIRKVTTAGVVTTLAGSGAATSTDGTGTGATFYGPSSITIDGSNNLYVTDQFTHKIRKVTQAGVVTTLAGSGTGGSTDGTGTGATFNYPTSLIYDSINNVLYSGSLSEYKIRKITLAGVVTTLAGTGTSGITDGTGIGASIGQASSMTIDTSGNLYFSDSGAVIRKITLTTGVVVTFSGNSLITYSKEGSIKTAAYSTISGMYIDATGTLFINDGTALRRLGY